MIDAEEEIFQQFVQELGKEFEVTNLGKEVGRNVVDFHSRLNASSPLLAPKQRDMIVALLLMAQQKGYRVRSRGLGTHAGGHGLLALLNTATELRNELISDLGSLVDSGALFRWPCPGASKTFDGRFFQLRSREILQPASD